MEHHVNATSNATTTTPTLRHQQQQQQQPASHNENQQQFCLRWHNHQTSLLSTLPVLLEQSHLTDVTISVEGRNLPAHRVVLSACSTFFLELFRALETNSHPVIILPGATFAATMALLTFMYSGEVNVYEAQIPQLLSLAETLGIKGLADVQNNKPSKRQHTDFLAEFARLRKEEPLDVPPTTPTPTPPPPPPPPPPSSAAVNLPPLHLAPPHTPTLPSATAPHPLANLLANKLPSPLESLLFKSLQLYPNLLPQPLNFSQTALNKTSELLAKYQQHCGLYEGALAAGGQFGGKFYGMEEFVPPANVEVDARYNAAKRLCLDSEKRAMVEQQQQQQLQQHHTQQHQHQQKDIRRIDRIVESLRGGHKTLPDTHAQQQYSLKPNNNMACNYNAPGGQQTLQHAGNHNLNNNNKNTHMTPPVAAPLYASATVSLCQQQQQQQSAFLHAAEQLQQPNLPTLYAAATCSNSSSSNSDAAATNRSTPNTPEANMSPNKSSQLTMPNSPTTTTLATGAATKPVSNSKLYATCFICHKQLSNQYNLRVHLETHQNVRYACNVCSHVSRSKDALRKHVSYRHPGAPSPCETEARRKRAASATAKAVATTAAATATVATLVPAVAATATATAAAYAVDSNADTTPQLTAAAYMFLPNQFQLANAAAAAAAAAAARKQQQEDNPQNVVSLLGSCATNNDNNNNNNSSSNSLSTIPAASGKPNNNNALAIVASDSNSASAVVAPLSQIKTETTPDTSEAAVAPALIVRPISPPPLGT